MIAAPKAVEPLVAALSIAFTRQTFQRVVVLVLGAILSFRRRIVTVPARRDAPRHACWACSNLPRTRVRGRQLGSLAGKTNSVSALCGTRGGIVVTRAPVKSKTPLSLVDHGGHSKRVMGLEPTTFTLAT